VNDAQGMAQTLGNNTNSAAPIEGLWLHEGKALGQGQDMDFCLKVKQPNQQIKVSMVSTSSI